MKHLLLTGATGGLGAAVVAEALAREWNITGLHGANKFRADVLRAAHANVGDRLQLHTADLSDARAVRELSRSLAAQSWDAFLHLAAAPLEISPFLKQDLSDFESQWRVMMLPAVAFTQAVMPGMRQRKKGCLLYCLSAVTLGETPKGMASYTSAKHALFGLVRSVAAECAGSGIVATCVSPGVMDTPLLRNLPELAKKQLGEFQDPANIADRILNLAENPNPANHAANLSLR